MKRRTFLQASTIAPLLSRGRNPLERDEELRAHRIVKVTGFVHRCPRPKFVGKNSHLDDHGDHTSDKVLRIVTNEGVEGIGSGSISEEQARSIVGRTLDELWSDAGGSVGLLGRADHALFDLVGKIREVPAWQLLGGKGPEWVDVYDGSIYFNDLLPQNASDGVRRLVEEVEQGIERGFRAFKIKVGRGYKWMPKAAGFERDVEVVRAIRKQVGPEVHLMVDANNAFDLEGAKRWLGEVGPQNLFFAEEMFPEDVEQDGALRAFLRENGWKTLVADGESAGEPRHFDPYLESDVLDVLQPDIRGFGLSLLWALSRSLEAKRSQSRLAPHNWGSFLGFPMQLMLARGIGNFLTAECDWSTSDLFDVSAFELREGKARVPNTPGSGIILREDVFNKRYKNDAWVVSER
jgi:L-alanine-DL-glutamate epimerase-like enolase superfamily enzyme